MSTNSYVKDPPGTQMKLVISRNMRKLRRNTWKQFDPLCLLFILMFCFCYLAFNHINIDHPKVRSPSAKTNPTRKVFLVTYTRSGSSFMGHILRSIPSSFYYFEPLLFYTDTHTTVNYTEMRSFINNLFNCEFDSWDAFFLWLKKKHLLFAQSNENFWEVCANGTDTRNCFNRTFNALYCQDTRNRVLKVTRYPPQDLFHLLAESPDIKVVYLIRDPRGVLKSRSRMPWCKDNTECQSEQRFCSLVHNDLKSVCLFQRDYPQSIFVVRYEDLACHPEQMAVQLMKFLGMSEVPQTVQDFLGSTTNGRLKGKDTYNVGAYTVTRDSDATAFAWQRSTDQRHIRYIQDQCGDVIKMLGWDLVEESRSEPLTCEADTNNVTDQYLPIRDICARSDLD